ncbi:MAG TPA: B12-binding domain-containing protein [Acidimicrobiales bacterium]|nr:B12-binding domain-containing protein [Acidimicrobiales bacterium]
MPDADPAPDETVDLADAAAHLGVHYQTAYRWVREGRLPAVRVRGRYQLAVADLDAFAASRDEPEPVAVRPGRRSWERLSAKLFDALRAGDERTAADVLVRLRSQGESIVDILTRVVVPAMRRVGDDWSAGRLTVAEEHRASEIVERLLAGLDQRRPGRPRGTVVVTAPAGELHGLPVSMAAAALRDDGWMVELLGRDLPVDALVQFVHDAAPDLVVLSVTDPSNEPAARDARDRLAADGQAVLVGGRGRTLEELLDQARSARRRPPPAEAG